MLHDCPTAKVTFYDITIGRISTAAGPAEEMMMRADWKNALTNQVQHKLWYLLKSTSHTLEISTDTGGDDDESRLEER